MYRNPIKIKDAPYNKFGDPFILRFNGKYYLYPSGDNTTDEIYCYTSDDLVHFKYAGIVAKEKILHNAYAPEVIYKDGYFYLITSPSGNGHYLYKSESPLGPFSRISENIKNMIDGSFFLDKDNNLYLLRANHYGISLLNIDENGNTSGRVNLEANMNGWTEGPGLFYFNGYYFLTYTGNDVCSTGYRVNYSYSKYFNKGFIEGINNSLLISTSGKYKRVGHSSNVLGPNLDNYYIVYHSLDIIKGVHKPRKLMIDRLNFNGSLMCANKSSFNVKEPLKPLISSIDASIFKIEGNLYLYRYYFNEFTLESYIALNSKVILYFKNKENLVYFEFNDDINLVGVKNNKKVILSSYKNNFKLKCFHTIRVIYKENNLELFIDNTFINRYFINLGKSEKGYILNNFNDIKFNAINNFAFNDSINKERTIVPGLIFLEQSKNNIFLEKYDSFAGFLKENEEINIPLNNIPGLYFLSIYLGNETDLTLLINDKEVTLNKENSEYDFNERGITFLNLKTNDTLKIKVIKGELKYQYIRIRKVNKYKKVNELKQRKFKDKYYLTTKDLLVNYLEFNFEIKKEQIYQKFGLVFEASDYSEDIFQARYPLRAIFVGIISNLLAISYFNYKEKRIYDVPITLNDKNNIKVYLKNNKIKVYLNDEEKIETTIPLMTRFGRVGLYKSCESKMKFLSFDFKEDTK